MGVGIVSLALMFGVAAAAGLPIRDPDARYVGSPLALIGVIVAIFLVLDIVPEGDSHGPLGGDRPRAGCRRLFLDRWWGRAAMIVIACLLGFYATYLAYRNLKSFLPALTDGEERRRLREFDRALFFGHNPAALLHDLLGTGVAADVLSASYLAFLTFVPVSLGIVLIWSSRVAVGVWYVTALALNWLLGALSYYLIPSLGPVYAQPDRFADLPVTGVSELQQTLLEHRAEVIADPRATDAVQSIAAFASLHIAVVFTAALIAQLAGAPACCGSRSGLPRADHALHRLLRLALRRRRRRRDRDRRHRDLHRRRAHRLLAQSPGSVVPVHTATGGYDLAWP